MLQLHDVPQIPSDSLCIFVILSSSVESDFLNKEFHVELEFLYQQKKKTNFGSFHSEAARSAKQILGLTAARAHRTHRGARTARPVRDENARKQKPHVYFRKTS